MHNPNLIELSWSEARASIAKANPKLAEIIDRWSPPDNYKLYKVSYQFGDHILHDGIFNLPDANSNLLPILHRDLPPEVNEALSYRSIPLGVVTKNAQEVYLELEERIISLSYFEPGVILGLWESLDDIHSFYPKQIWSVCAGARSLFMLPKVSEFGAHQRLCKAFEIRANIPRTMQEHQPLFVQIAKQSKSDWRQEVIFFSRQWLERDENNVGWMHFHHHLLELGWKFSEYNRNKNSYDLIWESFARSLEKSHRKPSLYLLNTLQHLIGISTGKVPGFKMALSEAAGPIKLLQDAYTQKYGLRQYFPTIMQPANFDYVHDKEPIYYSLQFPTCFETLPKNRAKNCLIDDLRELKDLMDHFINDAKAGKLKIADTPIEDVVDNFHFDYIHSDKDVYGKLILSENIAQIDRNFLEPANNKEHQKFATSSPFLRGCVAILRQ